MATSCGTRSRFGRRCVHLRRPVSLAVAATAVLALAGGGCGGGDDGVELSEAGARGRQVASANGCASCHGADGQGGAGPPWKGLYGANVELDDGTTVVADEQYLITAIRDPGAQRHAGYRLRMPANGLGDDEIADVIAYIDDLSRPDGDGSGSADG